MTRLNVGAGNMVVEGWTSVDVRASINTDICCPAWDLPFEDNSVDAIHSRHMIEHLTYPEAVKALREWHRVLKKRAAVEISCPDLLYCLELFKDPKSPNDIVPQFSNLKVAMGGLWGWQDYPENVHKWGWTLATLKHELYKVKFDNVWQVTFSKECLFPNMFRERGDVHVIATK